MLTSCCVDKSSSTVKEDKVIMANDIFSQAKENNFKYGKTYYIDKSGMPIDECEAHNIHSKCRKLIEACCRIHIPRGFRLGNCSPSLCFNLSNLHCNKNPIVQKVSLPNCECEHPKKCEVVTGYEIRAVGDVDFSVSIPICPINGFSFPRNSNTCCSATVPVNKIISYTCCPKPGSCNEPCFDWTYAFLCITREEDECGPYFRVEMGVALEYTGTCENDEE